MNDVSKRELITLSCDSPEADLFWPGSPSEPSQNLKLIRAVAKATRLPTQLYVFLYDNLPMCGVPLIPNYFERHGVFDLALSYWVPAYINLGRNEWQTLASLGEMALFRFDAPEDHEFFYKEPAAKFELSTFENYLSSLKDGKKMFALWRKMEDTYDFSLIRPPEHVWREMSEEYLDYLKSKYWENNPRYNTAIQRLYEDGWREILHQVYDWPTLGSLWLTAVNKKTRKVDAINFSFLAGRTVRDFVCLRRYGIKDVGIGMILKNVEYSLCRNALKYDLAGSFELGEYKRKVCPEQNPLHTYSFAAYKGSPAPEMAPPYFLDGVLVS